MTDIRATDPDVRGYQLASEFVGKKLHWFASGSNPPAIRAALANLRHGIAKAPGATPELWELTIADIPQQLVSQSGIATTGEWAIHLALCLYAIHQQGKDPQTRNMHCPNDETHKTGLGSAARKLISGDSNSTAVTRRFNIVATANSIEEFAHHLRGFIQLLRSENIPLDYVQLTRDLYFFQNPDNRDRMRLRWGQDFYASPSTPKE